MASPAVSHAFVAPAEASEELRVLALAFPSHQLASQALAAAQKLHDDGELELHDAVMLGRVAGHPAHVLSSMDPVPVAAAVPASLAGALVGALVAGPLGMLVGGALAGGGGALAAKLLDTGIPAHIVDNLRGSVGDDEFLVALLVNDSRAGAMVRFAMRCGTVGRSTILPV